MKWNERRLFIEIFLVVYWLDFLHLHCGVCAKIKSHCVWWKWKLKHCVKQKFQSKLQSKIDANSKSVLQWNSWKPITKLTYNPLWGKSRNVMKAHFEKHIKERNPPRSLWSFHLINNFVLVSSTVLAWRSTQHEIGKSVEWKNPAELDSRLDEFSCVYLHASMWRQRLSYLPCGSSTWHDSIVQINFRAFPSLSPPHR